MTTTTAAPVAAGPVAPTRTARARSRRNLRSALLFLSPWIVGFLVFTLWPVLYSAYLSLTDYDVINDPEFIGLENYRDMAADPKIALALTNTVVYTVLAVPLHVAGGGGRARQVERAGRGGGGVDTPG